jgi:RHS repeat-associated protein
MIAKGSKKNDKTKDKTHWKKNKKKRNKNKKQKKHTFEQIYYYHNDHLGTPQKLTNATGSVVWAIDYLPFGQAEITVGTIENNIRFAGQYYDSETGLHYNYHRYYNPAIGRYLTPDPIGLEGGINPYIYVQNNPVNAVDLFGLEAFHVSGTPYVFGSDRPGSPVKPGDPISKYLSDNVRHMDQTAKFHDNLVDFLEDRGLPYDLVNYPTMLPSYTAACIYNSLTDYNEPNNGIIILFGIKW